MVTMKLTIFSLLLLLTWCRQSRAFSVFRPPAFRPSVSGINLHPRQINPARIPTWKPSNLPSFPVRNPSNQYPKPQGPVNRFPLKPLPGANYNGHLHDHFNQLHPTTLDVNPHVPVLRPVIPPLRPPVHPRVPEFPSRRCNNSSDDCNETAEEGKIIMNPNFDLPVILPQVRVNNHLGSNTNLLYSGIHPAEDTTAYGKGLDNNLPTFPFPNIPSLEPDNNLSPLPDRIIRTSTVPKFRKRSAKLSDPGAISVSNSDSKEDEPSVRTTRQISKYQAPYGAVDYIPVGPNLHNEESAAGRYDVWNTDDAAININTLQSSHLPPGYYNYYQKPSDDIDDESEGGNRRAMGFRPIEQFSPPDKDVVINILNKHPQEYFQYSTNT